MAPRSRSLQAVVAVLAALAAGCTQSPSATDPAGLRRQARRRRELPALQEHQRGGRRARRDRLLPGHLDLLPGRRGDAEGGRARPGRSLERLRRRHARGGPAPEPVRLRRGDLLGEVEPGGAPSSSGWERTRATAPATSPAGTPVLSTAWTPVRPAHSAAVQADRREGALLLLRRRRREPGHGLHLLARQHPVRDARDRHRRAQPRPPRGLRRRRTSATGRSPPSRRAGPDRSRWPSTSSAGTDVIGASNRYFTFTSSDPAVASVDPERRGERQGERHRHGDGAAGRRPGGRCC